MSELGMVSQVSVAPKLRRWRWNGPLIIGLVLLGLVVLVAIFAPIFLTDQATALGTQSNKGSTAAHLLGTDSLGRDMLARTLVAARTTLVMAAFATALASVLGIAIGIGVRMAPRIIREPGLRVIEFLVSYPTLLVAIVVAAILGKGAVTAVIAIAVANTAGFARITSNLAAGLLSEEYVSSARLMGVPAHRLAVRHVLPNMAEPMLIIIAQSFAGALTEISGLSFVGLGSQSPAFDFGTLLNDALSKIVINPVLVIGPALALIITSLGALQIGDGLAAAANPRSSTVQARIDRRGNSISTTPDFQPLLTATGLTVTHAASGRELVRDVSFTIDRGEILGIVGESGSGKSLTASLISRLLPEGLHAEAQEISIDGTDLLGRVSQQELAQRFSLIYQDPGTALNPVLTLGSQFSDVLTTRLDMSKAEAKEKILESFSDVMLPNPEVQYGQRPYELSGGMKQRAMIASAMTIAPDLLIADEPSTALDVTVQREVLAIIKRMNEELGTSVLFISHDLGVIRRICDRVLVMRDGVVVEEINSTDSLTVESVTHPYTKQLLAAAPVVTIDGALPEAEGERSL